MNQNILSKMCIGVVVLLSAIGVVAEDHKPQPFSADFRFTSPSGKEMTGRLYMAWPKFRVDTTDAQHRIASSAIIDHGAQRAITLLPQYQTYDEFSIDQQKQTKSDPPIGSWFDASNPCAGHDSWSCKKIGLQTIAGRQCDVWEIVSDKTGPSTEWIDRKVNFPIKSKSADGILEYSNIQEGQPDPTHFQVPPGYKKSVAHSESTPRR